MANNFLKNLFISMRPRQWIKNFFVFAALIFAVKFADWVAWQKGLAAFGLFCLASSGVYLLNDAADYEKDRCHPVKKNRPVAAGALSRHAALFYAFLFLAAALITGFWLDYWFFWTLTGYVVLNIFYSFCLKNLVILDVISIALGFVLRAIAGAVVIGVVFSPWLLLGTFFLTLFLAVGKRKNELLCLAGADSRGVLNNYSVFFLDQMGLLAAASALMTYTLFTFSSWHSQWLIVTVPIVLYGLLRYFFIVGQKRACDNGPTDDLIYDRPLQLTVLVWVAVVLAILNIVPASAGN